MLRGLHALALLMGLLAWLTGCGASRPGSEQRWSGPAEPRDFFPTATGSVWSYDSRGAGQRHPLLTVVKLERFDGERAVLFNGKQRFERRYLANQVRKGESGAILLEGPLVVGTSWKLPGGGVARIVAVDESVTVPAGRFDGCLVVQEEADGMRVTRTLARGYGAVRIRVERVPSSPTESSVPVREALLRSYFAGDLESLLEARDSRVAGGEAAPE